MVDDTQYGKRDKRGHWRPFAKIEYAPVFVWPAQPAKFLKWLFGFPGYIFPWNFLYAAFAAVVWLWMTPSWETLKTIEPGWVCYLLARNALI